MTRQISRKKYLKIIFQKLFWILLKLLPNFHIIFISFLVWEFSRKLLESKNSFEGLLENFIFFLNFTYPTSEPQNYFHSFYHSELLTSFIITFSHHISFMHFNILCHVSNCYAYFWYVIKKILLHVRKFLEIGKVVL